MSFQAMTIALSIDLPATQKSLLLCLANYVNEQNKFWPSYNTLAKDSGMCRRTVITHMNNFVEKGIVDKKIQVCDKGNTSNLYTFKGVQYLKKSGYTISLTDTGYIAITKPQTNKLEGCKSITPLVQDDHPPSDPVAPNTINEPIKETKDLKNTCATGIAPIEKSSAIDDAFSKTWDAWHNKKNRIPAKKAFTKLCKQSPKVEPDFIATSLIQDFTNPQRMDEVGFENLHFSTYVNNRRWEDELSKPKAENKRVDPLLAAMGMG
jgi:hypothetical protein